MTSKLLPGSLLLAAILFPAGPSAATGPFLEKSILFREDQDGFRLYRIPGIIVTARGTALAYCEARKFTVADRGEMEIHLRRSTDGGRTWETPKQVAHLGPRLSRNSHMPKGKRGKDMGGPNEQTVNNPVAIAGRDGAIYFVYCVEYMRCFYLRSDDDGRCWSKPVEITSAFEPFRSLCDWQAIATGPGHGIELPSGRLVVPVWIAAYENGSPIPKASAVIYSDDDGRTWHSSQIAVPGGGESNVAELADGRVILTARNSDPRHRRAVTFSPDGATDWSRVVFVEELLEPGCMAGLFSCPIGNNGSESMLLFANPHTTKRAHQDRENLTIKASYDDGRTWPVSKMLQPGPSAYSDLAVLPDGTVLCFYESGSPRSPRKYKRPWAYSCLTVARFNLDWLTSGEVPRLRKSPIRE